MASRGIAAAIFVGLGTLVLPTAARAQSTIAGVVKDTSGAVLPGVTVEASSDVLIERTRSVITDAAGQYKIVDLRPGVYVVTFTLGGSWRYLEYEAVNRAGSYLYEPGGSTHTFFCPADNTEDTITLAWIQGAQVSFNEDGTFHSLNDAVGVQYLVETAEEAAGTGPTPFIKGGNAANGAS